MRTTLSRIIPESFKKPLRRAWLKMRHFGLRRYCPICGSRLGSFGSFGLEPRPDALCPVCGSLERHRLVWVFFDSRTNLLDGSGKKMLHVAPEKEIEAKLRKTRGLDYLTADLYDQHAMVQMDITNIGYGADTFDVIYCSHVLEHVGDDRKAMRELNRVLKPDGWAVFVVPIKVAKTIEDPSVADPAERERLFGQHDHVRRYGPDFVDRLKGAGFSVTTFSSDDIAGAGNIVRFGIQNEQLFLCTKKL